MTKISSYMKNSQRVKPHQALTVNLVIAQQFGLDALLVAVGAANDRRPAKDNSTLMFTNVTNVDLTDGYFARFTIPFSDHDKLTLTIPKQVIAHIASFNNPETANRLGFV